MEIKFKDGIYDGPVKNGVPHGKRGTYTFNSGARFLGDFVDGSPKGSGIFYLDRNQNENVSSNFFDGFYNCSSGIFDSLFISSTVVGKMVDGVFYDEITGEKYNLGLNVTKTTSSAKKPSGTSKQTSTPTTSTKKHSSASEQLQQAALDLKNAPKKPKKKIVLEFGVYNGEVDPLGLPHGEGILKTHDGIEIDGEFENGDLYGFATFYFPDGTEVDGDYIGFHNSSDGSYDHEDLDEILDGYVKRDVFIFKSGKKKTLPTASLRKITYADLNANGKATQKAVKKQPLIKMDASINASASSIEAIKKCSGISASSNVNTSSVKASTPPPPKTSKLRLKDGNYEGEVKNGVPHGKGKITYFDGHRYEGDFVNGKRIGFGTLYFVDGDRLECVFKDDYPNGNGVLYLNDCPNEGEFIGDITDFYNCYHRDFRTGASYSGAFKNGKYNGRGIWDSKNGTHYQGEFKDNKYHGYGEILFANGAKYMGDFKDGEYHGKGYYRFPDFSSIKGNFKNGKPDGYCEYYSDDTIYKGEYKNGKWHGEGKLAKSNGYIFEGTFVDGKTDKAKPKEQPKRLTNVPWTVEGTLTNKSGTKYEGEHLNGVPHGKGKMTFADGSYYEGEFRDGLRHGVGKYIYASGITHQGCYIKDKKHAYGEMRYPDGSYYKGEFENDMFNGLGTLCDKGNGWTYKGYFKDDYLESKGEAYSANGEKYIGCFHKSNSHGKGKYYYKDGSTYEGEFTNGEWDGEGYYVSIEGWSFKGKFRMGNHAGYGELYRINGVVIKGNFTSYNDATDASAECNGSTCYGTYRNGKFTVDENDPRNYSSYDDDDYDD